MQSGRIIGSVLLMAFASAEAKTVTYYYTDPQGTVLATTDASGQIVQASDRRPFGAPVLGDPHSGPGYTGHASDEESGLIYMQARYYDASIGRFQSGDPTTWLPGNLDRFNRFQYVGNSPYNNIDPDGRDEVVIAGGRREGSMNVFGHIGVAVQGYGMASYGTDTPLGSSAYNYVAEQSRHRNQVITLIPTTSTEDAAAASKITNQLNSNTATVVDNCAVKVNMILHAANVATEDSAFPGSTSRSASAQPGAKSWYVAQNATIPSDLAELLRRLDASRTNQQIKPSDNQDNQAPQKQDSAPIEPTDPPRKDDTHGTS